MKEFAQTQCGVGFGKIRIDIQGFHRRRFRLRHFLACRCVNIRQPVVTISKPGIGKGVLRINLDSLCKKSYRSPQAGLAELIPMITSFQVKVVCLTIIGVLLREPVSLFTS